VRTTTANALEKLSLSSLAGQDPDEHDKHTLESEEQTTKKRKKSNDNEDVSDRKENSKRSDMATYDDEDEKELAAASEDEKEEDGEVEEKQPGEEEKELRFVNQITFGKGQCSFNVSINATGKKIMIMGLLEDLLARTPAYLVEGVFKAVVVKTKDGFSVITEGINLPATWVLQHKFDVKRLTCNQPHDMIDVYGVEAGRSTIVSEISNVFNVYGIGVDHRHKALIGDYMTKSGSFRAMNRHALKTSASVYQKASFESTLKFIGEAATMGQVDSTRNPSASLVLGKVVELGTGIFECYQPILSY